MSETVKGYRVDHAAEAAKRKRWNDMMCVEEASRDIKPGYYPEVGNVEAAQAEPVATDEQMEQIDRDLDARLAAELGLTGASDVLREADHIINNGRKASYGHPTENFRRIAAGWREILGVPVSHRQIALMMAWLKIARDIETPKRDNLVDGAGYLAIAAEV